MSIEAARDFRASLGSDPALQVRCAEAIQSGAPSRVVEAGASRGFAFTEGELAACMSEGELSDRELELVSGGGQLGSNCPPPKMEGRAPAPPQ